MIVEGASIYSTNICWMLAVCQLRHRHRGGRGGHRQAGPWGVHISMEEIARNFKEGAETTFREATILGFGQ